MSHAPNWIEGVRKIAVLRANALGDFIFAQPALHALRSAYPEAEIDLLGKEWHAAYVKDRPGPINGVIPIPPYKGVSMPDTWVGPEDSSVIDDFFNKMQVKGFDLALQMHGGGGNSNPFVQRLGAAVTAGMRAPDAPTLDRWIPYVYWQHEALRLLEVVRLVGAPPVMLEPAIAVTPQDLAEACEQVPETEQPIIVLHPGASDPRRRWSAQKFAAVGDALQRQGYHIVVVGIEDEQPTVDAVLRSMQRPAQDCCGKLSLNGLTGLLARARLVIANDSGPRHLAEAVGTATIGIYWCGNLINAGSVYRALHRPHLSWRLECMICGANTIKNPCTHQASFVDDVSVDEVMESAVDVLRIAQNESTPAQ